jgi:nucleoside-diphosphate-sugar epimerase
MTILIIGGNRFVGKLLAENLLQSNNEITVFNRKGTGPKGCLIIKGDRNNLEDLNKINFPHFDCIIDMCLYKPEQFKLIEPLLEDTTPYIFISSGAAYKDTNIWPITEDNEILGMEAYGDYGVEKASVENLIKKSNLKKYKILRPTYIVGEGNHNPRLGHYIKCLQNNETINIAGNGENIINLVFAKDVVGCIKKVMLDTYHYTDIGINEYNISSDEFLTVNSLVFIIAKELGVLELSIKHDSSEAILPPNNYGIFSNKMIKKHHYNKFKTLQESLPNYIKWYNKNN